MFECGLQRKHTIGWENIEFRKREILRATLHDDFSLKRLYSYEEYKNTRVVRWCKACVARNYYGYGYYRPYFGTAYMYTPNLQQDKVVFSCVACNYQKKKDYDTKYQENVFLFEVPKKVKEASLKDLYKNDKNRVNFMKYVKTFIDDLSSNNHPKGIYLHGSYGTGKTYLIAALFNELAKKNVRSAIIYVPEFLRVLKSSFGEDFEEKYDYIKKVPLLLLDDIGAEYLTPWARDEIIGTILQYRMDEDLPTFFTSNLNLKQLEEHFSITSLGKEEIKGRRIIERIKDLTIEFALIGESNRK
jgi:DNA replication protein DnaC